MHRARVSSLVTEKDGHQDAISRPMHTCERLASKAQPRRIFQPTDGSCHGGWSFPISTADALVAVTVHPSATHVGQSNNTQQPAQESLTQQQIPADEAKVQLMPSASFPFGSDDKSPCDSHEADQSFLQTEQISFFSEQAAGSFCKALHDIDLLEVQVENATSEATYTERQECFGRRLSPRHRAASPTAPRKHSHKLVDTQEQLHRPSNRPGLNRVTKTSMTAQHAHQAPPNEHPGDNSSRQSLKMTALDSVLDSLRSACLADQSRAEARTKAAIESMEQEKKRFQNTISQQSADIAILRAKLQTVGDELKRSREKAVSIQKYVSGFQQDHEDSRKVIADFKEELKQLRENMAEATQENKDLKDALTGLASSTQSQKAKVDTLKEICVLYEMALSREKELGDRLDQHASLLDGEKNRRIELENHLLSSIQHMQLQLTESSTTLSDKVDCLRTDLEGDILTKDNDCNVKECLMSLQRLESLPLLTARDVRKAEGMLRYLQR